ncbi:hypothetical protein FOCC_FOCC016650 [Frankliniella occidentalis]|uniref:Uncharacterized protein LOC113212436 n=1 Tax=Frankliniella occidentalis TaxID=133901 RepID=A0A6J1T1P5_FRAOC|nr:uncharacterized protein LOC113212436 [Frankliniella occidentalis]KAE8737881.1 hypothetical protein FOCC_FOCC016650 [Frankliniella occidentalis]
MSHGRPVVSETFWTGTLGGIVFSHIKARALLPPAIPLSCPIVVCLVPSTQAMSKLNESEKVCVEQLCQIIPRSELIKIAKKILNDDTTEATEEVIKKLLNSKMPFKTFLNLVPAKDLKTFVGPSEKFLRDELINIINFKITNGRIKKKDVKPQGDGSTSSTPSKSPAPRSSRSAASSNTPSNSSPKQSPIVSAIETTEYETRSVKTIKRIEQFPVEKENGSG